MQTHRLIALTLSLATLLPSAPRAAEMQAQLRLANESVAMFRGVGIYGYSLDISSYDPTLAVTGELAPVYGTFTHGCYFAWNNPSGLDPVPGIMDLNVPTSGDANLDGFPDFFDSTQSGSGNSTGRYIIPGVMPYTPVTAQWSREAGSSLGTCVLTLQGLGTFTHPFQVVEYRGPLAYTQSSTTVTGTFGLVQVDSPQNAIGGTMEFVRLSTNRFNRLLLEANTWTNSTWETIYHDTTLILRDPSWPTNYYGEIQLDNDNEPGTFYPFAWYLVSLNDLNDADRDGIPDLSDDVGGPARAPTLSLTTTATNLMLTIRGEVGRLHHVEEAHSLQAVNWPTVKSVALATDPEQVFLPFPGTSPTFWRVQTE